MNMGGILSDVCVCRTVRNGDRPGSGVSGQGCRIPDPFPRGARQRPDDGGFAVWIRRSSSPRMTDCGSIPAGSPPRSSAESASSAPERSSSTGPRPRADHRRSLWATAGIGLAAGHVCRGGCGDGADAVRPGGVDALLPGRLGRRRTMIIFSAPSRADRRHVLETPKPGSIRLSPMRSKRSGHPKGWSIVPRWSSAPKVPAGMNLLSSCCVPIPISRSF